MLLPMGLAALLALASCSGDDGGPSGPRDATPPTITVVNPSEGSFVGARPSFFIRVTDLGSGVFCNSIEATISGANVSEFFRRGCEEESGDVSVAGGAINPGLADGGRTLTFRISDRAGNQATATRQFTVDTEPGGGPPPS